MAEHAHTTPPRAAPKLAAVTYAEMRPTSQVEIPEGFFPDGPDPLAYAVQGAGTCMEPEVADGSMLIASPAKRLGAGSLVVVWFFNATPMFKRLVRPPFFPLEVSHNPASTVIEQLLFEMLNPYRRLACRADKVEAIHAVAGVIPPGGFKRLPLRRRAAARRESVA